MDSHIASSADAQLIDSVELPWLVTVRWAGVVAGIAALGTGADLTDPATLAWPFVLLLSAVGSNLWLAWRIRRPAEAARRMGGWLVAADVVILSIVLRYAGGVLNPASIFYLVDIVLAALVLGRAWTWVVALLSIGGYGGLFLAPPSALAVAGAMHPEIGAHVRGMWLAFAATASIVAVLVSRLVAMVERRDRALLALRDRSARDARLAALTTLSAGAAHELSTPLATIAVASRELERALVSSVGPGDLASDVRLIRDEVDRCRSILNDMAARISEPIGEMPVTIAGRAIVDQAIATLPAAERARIVATIPSNPTVVWPTGVVARALANILRNAVQASPADASVTFHMTASSSDDRIEMTIADRGSGMSTDVRERAGEPFFTTKHDGSGMGLGLFVTRSTLEQLGGSMRIDSHPETGTSVTITLPARIDGGRRP